jgi:hypothetical protein
MIPPHVKNGLFQIEQYEYFTFPAFGCQASRIPGDRLDLITVMKAFAEGDQAI